MEKEILVIQDGTRKINDYQYKRKTFECVKFPDSLEEIGKWAFNQCANVKGFLLPDGIKKIQDYAFYETKAVVFIPKSIEYIGREAFGYDVDAYFECGEKDFEGYFHAEQGENDHPFAFHGYGGSCTNLIYYYCNASKLHFHVPKEVFLEKFKDLIG